MLAIIPALVGAGISIYIIQRIAMRFLRRKDRSRQWAEMRRHLRWLDIQLIRSMRPTSSSSSASVPAVMVPSSVSGIVKESHHQRQYSSASSRYGPSSSSSSSYPTIPSSPLSSAATPAVGGNQSSIAHHMANSVAAMSDSQLGFFLLRLRRLAALEYALPRDQRPLMQRDIDHLRSLEFDCHQKNLIIASMYRTYPFLSLDSAAGHHLPL